MKIIHVFLMLALIAGGYFIRDVVEPTKEAKAAVAGMTYSELKRDRDFKKAVRKVVERYCTVSGSYLDC